MLGFFFSSCRSAVQSHIIQQRPVHGLQPSEFLHSREKELQSSEQQTLEMTLHPSAPPLLLKQQAYLHQKASSGFVLMLLAAMSKPIPRGGHWLPMLLRFHHSCSFYPQVNQLFLQFWSKPFYQPQLIRQSTHLQT